MENLVVIVDPAEMKTLIQELADKDFITYDVETNGVEKDSEIIGASWCYTPETAYYAVISFWDKEEKALIPIPGMKEAVTDLVKVLSTKNTIMHNAIFDCFMTENNLGVRLIDSVHTDTMVLAHLVDENRRVGLKELGLSVFGDESATLEQKEMKASVVANGGKMTKKDYELYKADWELIGRYGAKDALLTLKLFYHESERLLVQGLDTFFYEETMPLLRGPTYQMNTTGLKVDVEALQTLKKTLEAEMLADKAFIDQEVYPHVREAYPADKKNNAFNIASGAQLSWLLFVKLENHFDTLTETGKALCKALELKLPYAVKDKYVFIDVVKAAKGQEFQTYDKKLKRMKSCKIRDYWNYFSTDEGTLSKFAKKYKWVQAYQTYTKNGKLLKTYVMGIESRMRYGIIRPSFIQHTTPSGRYSSKNPNFQNLPRKEKRVKGLIIARPGKVLVGADADQLEPRCFASISKDETLMSCFTSGDDFYSTIGVPIFGRHECNLIKDAPGSFSVTHPDERDKTKVIALATPYGRTPGFMASEMGSSIEEAAELMDGLFKQFPKLEKMMLDTHEEAKANGVVYSLFGRPRRLPEAKELTKIYGKAKHRDLPYIARNVLNQAMNFKPQSTGASIMNRAAIAFLKHAKELGLDDVRLVMQVHDELIAECDECNGPIVSELLKFSMEETNKLPGVPLKTTPKIAKRLSDLK